MHAADRMDLLACLLLIWLLLGSVELDLLPRGAVLVNVGRGAVVDEQVYAYVYA